MAGLLFVKLLHVHILHTVRLQEGNDVMKHSSVSVRDSEIMIVFVQEVRMKPFKKKKKTNRTCKICSEKFMLYRKEGELSQISHFRHNNIHITSG